MNNEFSFPLTMGKIKGKFKINKIKGKQEIVKHLENLGFIKGAEIVILEISNKGAIVKIQNSKIALDDNICKNILISELKIQEHSM